MRLDRIKTAEAEARRFLERVSRASLDRTRALASMRRRA